jgi:transposase-like protein
MPKSVFEAAHFQDAEAARTLIEQIRWPNGPICGHCGEAERRYATKRPGRYRCGSEGCRMDYTVTTGTVMESSHVPLHKWMQAFYLCSASKKGFSAHQLHRTIGVTYKTAWFMHHRIMEAMRAGGLEPMGGSGKIVEADETYFGPTSEKTTKTTRGREFTKGGRTGPSNKRAIVSLVERGGNVRSFHVPYANAETVAEIVSENISRESKLFTDESKLYRKVGYQFFDHETVRHTAKEYARGEVHTNTVEGYFSIFKRGMRGVYQHCKEKHLHRYLAEFDFRYNNRAITDTERTEEAVKGSIGKRITYQQPRQT